MRKYPDIAGQFARERELKEIVWAKFRELLESDQIALRKFWNEHWPERELEQIANQLGYSFD